MERTWSSLRERILSRAGPISTKFVNVPESRVPGVSTSPTSKQTLSSTLTHLLFFPCPFLRFPSLVHSHVYRVVNPISFFMAGFLDGSSERAILVVRVLELVWNNLFFASFRFGLCYDPFRGSFSSWADILRVVNQKHRSHGGSRMSRMSSGTCSHRERYAFG